MIDEINEIKKGVGGIGTTKKNFYKTSIDTECLTPEL